MENHPNDDVTMTALSTNQRRKAGARAQAEATREPRQLAKRQGALSDSIENFAQELGVTVGELQNLLDAGCIQSWLPAPDPDPLPNGLSKREFERLHSEWKNAIRARLPQIEAEVEARQQLRLAFSASLTELFAGLSVAQ